MYNYLEVKEKRIELGVTQEELSTLTGIPQATISMGEKRGSKISSAVKGVIDGAFKKIETDRKNGNYKIGKQEVKGNGSTNTIVNGNSAQDVNKMQAATLDFSELIDALKVSQTHITEGQTLLSGSQTLLSENQALLKESQAQVNKLIAVIEQLGNKLVMT